MVVETNFPRGGRKPPSNAKQTNIKRDHDLFGRRRKKVVRHPGKTNIIQAEDDTSKSDGVRYVEQLKGKTVQDGMIMLGCVKQIHKVALDISLPGRLWGKVFVNNISKPYTKVLQAVVEQSETEEYKPLDEIFALGQCVAVKLITTNEEKFSFTLSMMPQQINANISHTSISAEMTLWGAISEVEDHGYVVDLGINHCRAFLKKEHCDVNKTYVVGELLWMAVEKADVSSTATIVSLNAQKEKIKSTKLFKVTSLDHLLPGMQIDFRISEVLSNGLEGTFLDDYTGYIDVGQLKKYLHHKDEYKVGNILKARILYMMPVTKIVYFTVKDLEPHKMEKLKEGAIMNCKVQGVTPFGIYIKLINTPSRGFVPMHRIQTNVSNDTHQNNYIYLKRKYAKRSIHQCRILSYDYFEQMYICSLEKQLVDKNYICTLDNLNAGMTVSVEIREIQPNGLLVKVDQINGYIKNEHICDTVLKNYNAVKSRLKAGQKLQARVWAINKTKNVLYFTMRPSLLKTDSILKDYNQVIEKQQYLGVIRNITRSGLLVQFFGDVHGWVPVKKMPFKGITDTNILFKTGQLVKCTVVKCKKQKLTLSLQSSTEIAEDSKPELLLGEHVNGIVSHITNEGVHVITKDSEINAFVPTSYLSKFPKVATIFAKIYQPGDEISNLVCISKNETLPTLSLRNPEVNEDNIQDLENLDTGAILSCTVLTKDSFGINVDAPIEKLKNNIFVPAENISDERDFTSSHIKINQLIRAKVFNISKNFKTVTASTKLSDVWNFDIQSSVQYFSEYLREVLQIRDLLKSMNNPVACLNLGEIVSGIVSSVNEDKSSVILLENGARAFVQSEHIKENMSVNDRVEGAVLFWDFENNVAEVALCPKLISRINRIQNGKINIPPGVTNKSNSHAEVILVKDDFILGVLRGAAGKRQIVFFPTKLHPNDLKPDLSHYVIGDYINVQVNKIEKGLIICLLKQLIKDLNYKWRKSLKYKRKSDDNDELIEGKRIKLEDSIDTKSKKQKNIGNKQTDENDLKTSAFSTENDIIIKEEPLSNDETENEYNETNSSIKWEKIKTKKEKISTEEEIIKNKKNKKGSKKEKSLSTDEESIGNTKDEKKKNSISMNEKSIEFNKKTVNVIKKKTSIPEDGNRQKNDKANKKQNEKNKDNNVIGHLDKGDKRRKRISVSDEQHMGMGNENDEKRKKEENIKNTKKSKIESIPVENISAVLPGADNFWNITEDQEGSEESSSDDELDQKELEKFKKKKRLTPAEKAEEARLEEERIRKIEIELADAENAPKTADQFDRLVLANPNNSMLWINYMAFHLEATEIEKARAIARKALNTIIFREEQERLNVWIAFLNLENRYGTQESFTSVLAEAVKMNDALSVYLQALNILCDSKKTAEFLDLIQIVSRKFKQDFKMWVETAEACYKCDLKEEARNLMQRSLKSLEEKQHVNLLVQFALMESRFNEPERAEALLEKILASYPRRVDVWTSYVDMLIKNNRIHIARNVLERAIGQKLPARKMKTLFSKFIQFETKYGDEERVKNVRKLAAVYVKTALN